MKIFHNSQKLYKFNYSGILGNFHYNVIFNGYCCSQRLQNCHIPFPSSNNKYEVIQYGKQKFHEENEAFHSYLSRGFSDNPLWPDTNDGNENFSHQQPLEKKRGGVHKPGRNFRKPVKYFSAELLGY